MTFKRSLFFIALAGLLVRLAMWEYFRLDTRGLVTFRLPDDALYYFTMARHLANGSGISFDGVHPSNGMHPLWLITITPIFLLPLSKWGAIHVVLLLQSMLDAVVIWLIGTTVYPLLPSAKESNRLSAAIFGATLYALGSVVLFRGINGLETTLAALLFVVWLRVVLWTVAAQVRYGRWACLGIVTGLLLLARTDSFVVLLPAATYLLFRFRAEWKGMLLAVIVAVAIVGPWLVWNEITFGTIVQSSAEAVPMLAMRKYHAIYGNAKNFHLVLDAARNALKPFWLAGFGVPLVSILVALFRRRRNLSLPETTVYLLVAGGVLLLVVHSVFRGFIRHWYVVELLPLFFVAFALSIGANAGTTEVRKSGRWALATILIVLQVFLYASAQYTSQAAVLLKGVPEMQLLTRTAKVATFNSGYYGYFSEHPAHVVNIDGVVNEAALKALKSGTLHQYLAEDSVNDILDFQGDFGGYVNLFDPHLLDGFARDTSFGVANPSNDDLILYRRK